MFEEDSLMTLSEPLENIESVCRVCLQDGVVKSVFADDEVPKLSHKINECASIQVELGDGLPQNICEYCISELNLAYYFRNQCRLSDTKLRRALKIVSNKTDDKITNNNVKTNNNDDTNEPMATVEKESPLCADICTQTDNDVLLPIFFNIAVQTDVSSIQESAPDTSDLPKVGYSLRKPRVVACVNKTKSYDTPKNVTKVSKQIDLTLDSSTSFKDLVNIPVDITKNNLLSETVTLDVSSNVNDIEALSEVTDCIVVPYTNDSNLEVAALLNLPPNTLNGTLEKIPFHVDAPMITNTNGITKTEPVVLEISRNIEPVLLKNKTECIDLSQNGTELDIDMDLTSSANDLPKSSEEHTRFNEKEINLLSELANRPKSENSDEENIEIKDEEDVKHRTHHECKQCGKTFIFLSRLRQHEVSHSGLRPFKCEICGKMYSRKDTLISHLRTHTNKKPYQCDKCVAHFTRRNSLNKHYYIHTNVKKYNCNLCLKTFGRRDNYNIHMKTHLGVKPFKCENCPKSFIRSDVLMRHRKTHENNRKYICAICLKTYCRADVLRAHLKKHVKKAFLD